MSYIFSHIFIPMAILLAFSKKLNLDTKKITILGFYGILPDLDVILLHRETFHNIFIIIIPIIVYFFIRFEFLIINFYLLSHLILDLFNGGISALYPFYNGIFFINTEIRSSYNVDGLMYTLNYGIEEDFVNNIARSGNGYGIISSENFGIIILIIIIILVYLIKNRIYKYGKSDN